MLHATVFDEVVGVEYVNGKTIIHEKRNPRALITFIAWALISAALFGVVASCDEGMYQGPGDDQPRYTRKV